MLTSVAVLIVTTALAAAPEKAAAKPAADPAAVKAAEKAAAAPQAPALAKDSPAYKDAVQALLGPCSPAMADAKVTSVKVIDGKAMNAVLEREKSKQTRADPAALFLEVAYEAGGKKDSDFRQVSTEYHLTTEQAQALLGEKMCVIAKAP